MFKVNNKNIRSTSKFIGNSERISHPFLVFLLLILNTKWDV